MSPRSSYNKWAWSKDINREERIMKLLPEKELNPHFWRASKRKTTHCWKLMCSASLLAPLHCLPFACWNIPVTQQHGKLVLDSQWFLLWVIFCLLWLWVDWFLNIYIRNRSLRLRVVHPHPTRPFPLSNLHWKEQNALQLPASPFVSSLPFLYNSVWSAVILFGAGSFGGLFRLGDTSRLLNLHAQHLGGNNFCCIPLGSGFFPF